MEAKQVFFWNLDENINTLVFKSDLFEMLLYQICWKINFFIDYWIEIVISSLLETCYH